MGIRFGEISNEIFEIIGKDDYENLLNCCNEEIKEIDFE